MPWRPAPRKRIVVDDDEWSGDRDVVRLSLFGVPAEPPRSAEAPRSDDRTPPPRRPTVQPRPIAPVLAARGAPTAGPTPTLPLGYELIRHIFVSPETAVSRFGAWRPRAVRTRGAVLEITDRTETRIGGRLHRRLRRDIDVELALEPCSPHRVVIRLTPDLHRRRWSLPTDRWWHVAHGVADVAVAVVRADGRDR